MGHYGSEKGFTALGRIWRRRNEKEKEKNLTPQLDGVDASSRRFSRHVPSASRRSGVDGRVLEFLFSFFLLSRDLAEPSAELAPSVFTDTQKVVRPPDRRQSSAPITTSTTPPHPEKRPPAPLASVLTYVATRTLNFPTRSKRARGRDKDFLGFPM